MCFFPGSPRLKRAGRRGNSGSFMRSNNALCRSCHSKMRRPRSQGVQRDIQERALKLWCAVDSDLGARIAQGLGLQVKSPLPASAE